MDLAADELESTRWLDATVRATSTPAVNVRELELVIAEFTSDYSPGSHVDVEVHIEGHRARRSYSLVGQTRNPHSLIIAVKRVASSRGGSQYMWTLEPGDTLRVSAPKNHFELAHGAPEYLLLAGGIGITPLLGMAQALEQRGASFRLLYAARHRSEMAYLSLLETLLGNRLQIAVSEEGCRFDLVQELSHLHPLGELYVCGPIGLMEAAKRAWSDAGRASTRCRLETFGSSGHLETKPFVAHVQDRNLVVAVGCDQSLFDALTAKGIALAGHCRRGECGLCVVDVLGHEGELDHRDVFLSEGEKAGGRSLCTCVSRTSGTITIDTGYRELTP